MITFPKYFTANFVAWSLNHKIITPLDLETFNWWSVYRKADAKIHYRLNGGPLIMGIHGDAPLQFRSFRDLKKNYHVVVDMVRFRLDFEVNTARLDARFPIYTNLDICRHCTDGDARVREGMIEFYKNNRPRTL